MLSGGLVTLSASGHKAALIFRAPKTGSITDLMFGTRNVTTGATVDLRLETVSATDGFPTGTLQATNTNAAVVVDSADDNVVKTGTLTASATVTKGDVLALVIVNDSVSPGTMIIAAEARTTHNFPYSASITTASWGKSQANIIAGVKYSDGKCYPLHGVLLATATNAPSFNSGSTPDERGFKFQLPFSARVTGAWAQGIIGSGDADLVLYDSSDAVIASTSIDHDQTCGFSGDLALLYFAASPTLSANTDYRLVLKPTSATNVSITELALADATHRGAYDGGDAFQFTSRTDAGAWTDSPLTWPMLGLIIDAVNSGGGTTVIVVEDD